MRWLFRIIVIGLHVLVVLILFGKAFLSFDSAPRSSRPEASSEEAGVPDSTGEKSGMPKESTGVSAEGDGNDVSLVKTLRSDLLSDRRRYELPKQLRSKAATCSAAVVIDLSDSAILWEKNLERSVPIASLTKMMTALELVEYVQNARRLSLNSPIKVSKDAAAVGGSQIYMSPGETFTVREVLQAMMIFSACDAAYAAAEFVGNGQVSKGLRRMNRRAGELGLKSLHFSNPHGLPIYKDHEKPNRGNVLDLSLLAAKLLEYPSVVKAASTWMTYLRQDTEKPFQLVNRNRLVHDLPGVNGMKTGYTEMAGFCMAATYEKNDQRMIVTVTGCDSQRSRNDLVADLLQWALTQSSAEGAASADKHIVKPGDTLYDIARKYDVSVSALKKANNVEGDLIHKGQLLVIPR